MIPLHRDPDRGRSTVRTPAPGATPTPPDVRPPGRRAARTTAGRRLVTLVGSLPLASAVVPAAPAAAVADPPPLPAHHLGKAPGEHSISGVQVTGAGVWVETVGHAGWRPVAAWRHAVH